MHTSVCSHSSLHHSPNHLPDKKSIDCLNFDQSYPAENALFSDKTTSYVQTDCDHQLILTVKFTMPVKLKQLTIKPLDEAMAPRIIKLFKNKRQMGFDDCESEPATQVLELKTNKGESVFTLKFVKFQSVHSLTVPTSSRTQSTILLSFSSRKTSAMS